MTVNIELIVPLIRTLHCKCRIKTFADPEPSDWCSPLFVPVKNYVELGTYGPVRISDVQWIEIDPVVKQFVGVRVPDKMIDLTDEVSAALNEQGISYAVANRILHIPIKV